MDALLVKPVGGLLKVAVCILFVADSCRYIDEQGIGGMAWSAANATLLNPAALYACDVSAGVSSSICRSEGGLLSAGARVRLLGETLYGDTRYLHLQYRADNGVHARWIRMSGQGNVLLDRSTTVFLPALVAAVTH